MQKSLAGLSLRDLEYVEAVAELKHFGRAAERCGVSQPALSEQIRKLESYLDVQQIERILSEARHLLAMGGQRAAGLSGVLQLGAIETLGPYYLPALLKLLRKNLPDISLRLSENRTAILVERLRHGVLDAILMVPGAEMPGLVTAPLFFERFLLAVPIDHPLQNLPRIRLDSLPVADLLLLEEGHCLRDQALALCRGSPEATRHATGLETLWQMIAAGEGYSLLPELAVAARPEIRDRLHCRALEEPNAGREIALVWRGSDPREAQFRNLAELLRAHAPVRLAGPAF